MVTNATGKMKNDGTLRKVPNTQGEKVKGLKAGDGFTITGRNEDGTWLNVLTGNVSGWIYTPHTTVTNSKTLPLITATTPQTPPSPTPSAGRRTWWMDVRKWQNNNNEWLRKDNNGIKLVLFILLVILIVIALAAIFRGLQTPPGTPGGGGGGGGILVPGDEGGQGGAAGNGEQMAEAAWGEDLPWPIPQYQSGQPGYPEDCAGLCWDKNKPGILRWYGPSHAEEDVTQSDVAFGDGTMSPLEQIRQGRVQTVIFGIAQAGQMTICPIGTLDGEAISTLLQNAGVAEGECGILAVSEGWHIVENNGGRPESGFGVRFSASGWAAMGEAQILEYDRYWTVSGSTATWVGPANREIILTPVLVGNMQTYGTLTTVTFTTSTPGSIFFCNGRISGSATMDSPDGACREHPVNAGTFTYHGEARPSAGVRWLGR